MTPPVSGSLCTKGSWLVKGGGEVKKDEDCLAVSLKLLIFAKKYCLWKIMDQ